MKTITVSIPDDVYRRARIKAAESGTSVSALVRQFLSGLTDQDSDFERLSRLQSDVIATIGRFRAGDRLRRDRVENPFAGIE